MKILMVCLGNICRSPLAEGILKKKAEENGLNWEIDSCGTSGWHNGKLPDNRSVEVAKKNGLDITYQRSRKLTENDLSEFDIIYAMDSSNYQDIRQLVVNHSEENKIKLILNEAWEGQNRAVPDPYWDDNGFEKVYQMLDEACDKIVEKYG
ncbi:UNVERIFIED_CONTAM: hypothetical protein GTU68_049501 [Idotea baltica]|nr:hypothetical protein [Idotea baltica]